MHNDLQQRFRELLPFYVAGTLTNEERSHVQDYLSLNPEAHHELAVIEKFRDHVRELGSDRDLAELTASFIERFAKEIPVGFADWMQRYLKRPWWLSGIVGAPALVLNALEVDLVEAGAAALDFLRIPDLIDSLQNLLTPEIVESLYQAAQRIA